MKFTERDFFEIILDDEGIGFALFNADLILINSSPDLAKRILNEDLASDIRFMDLFPELSGMEDDIKGLMGTNERMEIPRINYVDQAYSYVDLQIVSREKELLVVWKDTSSAGVLEQRIVQQRNDMVLLNRKLEKAYRMLGDLSGIDELTKLLNRQAATYVFKHKISKAQDEKFPINIFFIDIDNFKQINDKHGHAYGDQALAFVGEVFRDNTRSTDSIARWGGDEFVMLSSDMNPSGAERIVRKILSILETKPCVFSENGEEIFIQISIGICSVNPDALSIVGLDEIINAADLAMYQSKRHGGNKVTFCEVNGSGIFNFPS